MKPIDSLIKEIAEINVQITDLNSDKVTAERNLTDINDAINQLDARRSALLQDLSKELVKK